MGQLLRIAETCAEEGITISTFSLNYSPAPEAVFPTQQNEAVAAYKYLIDKVAVDPAKIIVYGESAGGHLAVSLLDCLYLENIARPGGAMLVAPWVNMLDSGASFFRNKHLDLLHKPNLDKCAKQVTRGQADKETIRRMLDLTASVTKDRNFLPPVTWVTVGAHDLFLDDVSQFVENARDAGSNVLSEVVDNMPHVWQQVDLFRRKEYYKLQPGEPVGDIMKGNAINDPDQLNLQAALTTLVTPPNKPEFYATAGLLAPTIRFHKGKFYIICTNADIGPTGYTVQNFYVTTDDIWSGKWSKPINVDFKGIDTSLFFDDDDRVYVQGSWSLGVGKQPSSTIKQFEIDIATGKALSKAKEIWSGFSREDAEGPHIYRKDGYYYLVIAEGGTFEHHMVTAARSTNIWGPYESYGKNPLTTADGTDRYVQNTGHTDLFQDASGAWWAVLLGVRNDQGRHPMGRETFLTPVTWPTGGWPVFEPSVLLFEQLRVDPSNIGKNVTASLAVYKDELRHALIGFDHLTSTVFYQSIIGDKQALLKKEVAPSPDRLVLGINCTVDSYEFFFGTSPDDTHSLGSLDTLELSSNDFTGTVFGLHAQGDGDDKPVSFVTFEKFQVQDSVCTAKI
ncbi:hypothetical protein Sste5346_009665 [Sporothrix stenoceras]|uniref:Uncharacterized protein n=1 Tax=Sporothrix stenoceras TaxID=5173 RepID=A0ABR3YJB4_9PEZI